MPQGMLRAIVPAAGYHSEPGNPASLETEVLFGECVQLLDSSDTHYMVQSEYYSTPGFVQKEAFEPYAPERKHATHRINVPEANLYAGPRFKSGVIAALPFNARLTATGAQQETPEGLMLECEEGWVFEEQVRRINQPFSDYVALAQSRIGAGPYTWGGRRNPDCSALVMDALLACGIQCPRNVSEQVKLLGMLVKSDEAFSQLRKGDFVFWTDRKGSHVVIMTSPVACVHATIALPYRGVVEQPLADVIERQEKDGNGRPTAVRRFPNYRF